MAGNRNDDLHKYTISAEMVISELEVQLEEATRELEELRGYKAYLNRGDPIPFQYRKQVLQEHIVAILDIIGEDITREGLAQTPHRVAKMWLDELFAGYTKELPPLTTFDDDGYGDQLIILRDIPFYSLCEHHMVPFFGCVDIGYLPAGRVIGVSKLARVVKHVMARLQVQERASHEIANILEEHLKPDGVMVVVRGQHMCMQMRGVSVAGSSMITSAARGYFLDTTRGLRDEFLRLCQRAEGK